MDAASVIELRRTNDSRARVLDISAQLRTAVTESDDAGIARLLADLLRLRGLSRQRCIAMQLRALQSLVYLLRSAAMTDEMTGLHNRRGFIQCASRLLDVAVREHCPHRLIYFHLGAQPDVSTSVQMIVLRHMGNTLRDLFPNYGVQEALGRLGASKFAALTPRAEYLSRDSILRHIASTPAGQRPTRAGLGVGIAHFDPFHPVGVDELLASAQRAVRAREPRPRIVRLPLSPPIGTTHS